jgi:hypothetical protein
VLLGAGRSVNGYASFSQINSAAYLLLQSEALAGSAAVYWTLDNIWPNATNAQWTTTNSSVAEVSGLNLINQTTSSRTLRLTVQAGSTPVLLNLQVDVAGAAAFLYSGAYYQLGGLLTPAFPASYYDYMPYNYSPDLILALGIYSSNCPASTAVYISDRLPQPGPGQQNVTYNYTGAGIVLPGNGTEVSAILSGSQLQAASQTGQFYIAVVGDGQTSCSYTIGAQQGNVKQLLADQLLNSVRVWGTTVGGVYWTFSMQPDTDASIVLYNFRSTDSPTAASAVNVYTAFGGVPNPADPSSFSIVTAAKVAAIKAASGASSAIYLPGSLCPLTLDSLANGCPVLMAASTSDGISQMFTLVSMQTATLLTAGRTVVGSVSNYAQVFYALPVPAGQVGTVSVTILASSPLHLYCSYQYIRPTAQDFDWSFIVYAGNSTTVNISWAAPQLNSINGVALVASTCYCGLLADAAGFSLNFAFATAAVPPPPPPPSVSSSSSGRPSAAPSAVSSSSTPVVFSCACVVVVRPAVVSSVALRPVLVVRPARSAAIQSVLVLRPASSLAAVQLVVRPVPGRAVRGHLRARAGGRADGGGAAVAVQTAGRLRLSRCEEQGRRGAQEGRGSYQVKRRVAGDGAERERRARERAAVGQLRTTTTSQAELAARHAEHTQ